MSLFTVNRSQCKRDQICVSECPRKIITVDAEGFPVCSPENEALCVVCGHCVAVCPHEAMSLTAMPLESCTPIIGKISSEQVELLLKSRRSVRSYKKESVSRDVIDKIIEIARYAPTGMNAQDVQWTVIHSQASVDRVVGAVIDWMRALVKMGSPMAGAYNAASIVEAHDAGVDIVGRGAPHIIIAHAHKDNMLAQIDCSIALTYLMLASMPYGAGTCWAGFIQLAAGMSESVLKSLGLPEGHKCNGAMMIGYPKFAFHRIPMRKAPSIKWD